jgi:hypothetical protein
MREINTRNHIKTEKSIKHIKTGLNSSTAKTLHRNDDVRNRTGTASTEHIRGVTNVVTDPTDCEIYLQFNCKKL